MFKKLFVAVCISLVYLNVIAHTIIPFSLTPQGHIVFQAKVNGVKGEFILDTGAGINLVTKDFFNKLTGITTDGNYYSGFRSTGDRLDVQLYKADEIAIDNFMCKRPFITYLDTKVLGAIDGIISLKNFEKCIITIDYENGRLIIDDNKELAKLKKSASSVIPILLDDSRNISLGILCYVKLNDTLKAQFVLDSGAGRDIFRINSRYLTNLGIDISDTANVKKTVFNSELKKEYQNIIYRTKLNKLAILADDKIVNRDIKAQFVDGLIYDGIMSINWLGKTISISLPTKEIIINK